MHTKAADEAGSAASPTTGNVKGWFTQTSSKRRITAPFAGHRPLFHSITVKEDTLKMAEPAHSPRRSVEACSTLTKQHVEEQSADLA